MSPSNAVRTVWDAEAIDTSHLGFWPIQKIATIHASSGLIRGIPIERLSEALVGGGHAIGHATRDADFSPFSWDVLPLRFFEQCSDS
jgi:hypothetical protein